MINNTDVNIMWVLTGRSVKAMPAEEEKESVSMDTHTKSG